MDAADHIGAREHEVVVAAREGVAPEIAGAELRALDVRAHRAIEDERAARERVEIGRRESASHRGTGSPERKNARVRTGTRPAL